MSFSAAPSVKQGWPFKPLWGIPFPPSQGHCLACSCWACCSCPHSGAPAVHLHCPAQPCLVWAPPHRVAQMQNLRLGGTCSLLAGGCWLMESFLLIFLSNLGDSPLGLAWAGVARSGAGVGGHLGAVFILTCLMHQVGLAGSHQSCESRQAVHCRCPSPTRFPAKASALLGKVSPNFRARLGSALSHSLYFLSTVVLLLSSLPPSSPLPFFINPLTPTRDPFTLADHVFLVIV